MHDTERWSRLDPSGRYTIARTHMAELQAQAANDRMVRPARTPSTSQPDLRTRVGLWLVRIGAALVQGTEETAM